MRLLLRKSWEFIRYLWVDSLCIVQDDKDDKALLMQEMYQVYHRSYLTIIGLPGVRRGSRARQSVEEIETGFYLVVLPPYGELLTESVHSRRAWTSVYQPADMIIADQAGCKKHVLPVERYSSLETKSSFSAAA